ncbi:MAG: hypothetical protein H3C71_09015, partial [Flavobacteriales bacterium]|nr:hypothetical protein [Flavobacteriales bacterium]
YMQKGALDLYIKSDLIQQLKAKEGIEQYLLSNRKNIDWQYLTDRIDDVLKSETREMSELRMEAELLGDESNELFGTRSEAVFNLRHDYIGLGWIKRQLQRAQKEKNERRRNELLDMITDYEGKNIGAIYDNLGTANPAPNVVFGYPYDHGQPYVPTMLSEANRPGQRSMHFTQDEDQGVTLLYTDLPAGQRYILRLALVRPVFQDRYADRMKQKTQSLFANDKLIAKNIELPEYMSDFYSFEIPASLIKDGVLEIRLMRDTTLFSEEAKRTPVLKQAVDVANHMLQTSNRVEREQWRNTGGWGTLLSEAWLIPKK